MENNQITEITKDEEQRWEQVHSRVVEALNKTFVEYLDDRKLARELTSQIVAATRDEDKMQLASDEAVAHGLTSLRKRKTHGLEELVQQPYFARVVTQEETRNVEFRLGTASFPDERIIDWRKAPISKLYYDYQEGDEFCVTIQDREREGIIKLRRSYQGVKNNLNIIEMPEGTLQKNKEGWNYRPSHNAYSRSETHDGHLPPILSLITSEQFKLITCKPQKPMVIQGIAGSGKTTVALHRLAWLLHEDNSDNQPEKCLVVMLNRSLKAYVELTLPELKIHGVPIRTYHQWVNPLVSELVGPRPRGEFLRSRHLELFKSSFQCLQLLEQYVAQKNGVPIKDYIEELFLFYKFALEQDLLYFQWQQIREQLENQIQKRMMDFQDDTLLLHLIYAEHGYYPSQKANHLALCDHIVIDEAQDFGLAEIRALLNALDHHKTVTIVGDQAQKIVAGRHFGTWEELLHDAGFEDTTPISLTVSHRTTKEIMKVASLVRGSTDKVLDQSAKRSGAAPMYIVSESPQITPHLIGLWIDQRLKENNKTLCGIICRWPKQAYLLTEQLRKLGYPFVRLGHRDQFDFSPGVTVTNVHQVKGLEFRNVLIVDPVESNYKYGNTEERNLLYVAVTRAESRLDFVGFGSPTKLLPRLPQIKGQNLKEL